MSYIRIGWPRRRTKGETGAYVFSVGDRDDDADERYVQFWGMVEGRMENADFCYMIRNALRSHTSLSEEEVDEIWEEMVDSLVPEEEQRDEPLTDSEMIDEMAENMDGEFRDRVREEEEEEEATEGFGLSSPERSSYLAFSFGLLAGFGILYGLTPGIESLAGITSLPFIGDVAATNLDEILFGTVGGLLGGISSSVSWNWLRITTEKDGPAR